jgi:trehalose 6-phosphate phosphatase
VTGTSPADQATTQANQEKEGALRSEVRSGLEPFLRTISTARQAVLLLDYDGTLAPFHIRRDEAFPYPGVAQALQEVVSNGRTRVVVITGRDVSELHSLLIVHPRPEIWGVHGLQRLRPDGALEVLNLNQRTRNGLSEAKGWLNYQQLLHAAEFKPGGIAVHWRGLAASVAEYFRSRVMLGWRSIAERSGLKLQEFEEGIEILAPEANKGEAVRKLLREIGPDAPVAYLGDDIADESAFRAIGERGISVLVRREERQTSARFWLKPPDEVVEFLELWLRSCIQTARPDRGAAKAVNG